MIWSWSYQSSAVGDIESHLLDIVRAAELRNGVARVSGILAYDAFGYYQMLEGPFEAIARLKRSILRDRRHKVHTQRLVPRHDRGTPLSLPMAYIRTDIPHGKLLGPGRGDAMTSFERDLLARATDQYPTSYAERSPA